MYEKIRYENQILLSKMTEILQKDTQNYKVNELYLKLHNRSLNKSLRKKELMRITAENQVKSKYLDLLFHKRQS